jgi:hypothetical protein
VDSTRTLSDRLLAGAKAFTAGALVGKFVKRLTSLIDDDPLGLDWTAMTSQLPEATDDDAADLDRIVIALEVTAPDDDDAAKAIDAWQAVRPAKATRKASSGETVRDLPQWTCVTVYNASGVKVHENAREAGGQVYSLQYPSGQFLRNKCGVSGADWTPVLKFIQQHAKAGTSGSTSIGEYTVKVTA